MRIQSLAGLKATAEELGSHFFDADTMRFFRSKIPADGIRPVTDQRGYFLTSEQFVPFDGEPFAREFNVRDYEVVTREDGSQYLRIDTLETFESRREATAHLNEITETAREELVK